MPAALALAPQIVQAGGLGLPVGIVSKALLQCSPDYNSPAIAQLSN
ncbi:hypothetical protein [Microcoleus sp. FACHB-68]|nr:hypothetical protein [Microcoleus sp. FACHB-68]MBD1939316.1 hypothetical protein [Microcoleus sp. FACHB-68]